MRRKHKPGAGNAFWSTRRTFKYLTRSNKKTPSLPRGLLGRLWIKGSFSKGGSRIVLQPYPNSLTGGFVAEAQDAN